MKYLLSRAIRGYVYIIPAIIMYFLILSIFRRKQKPLHIVTVFIFSFYLLFIIAATGIGNTAASGFSPEIILIPLLDIFRAPTHFILNIVAFVPFGIFLPILYGKCCNIKFAAVTGFLFSLSIELVQMYGWGVTELDDLIANTLGVCFGYYSYSLIRARLNKNLVERFQAANINDIVELFYLSACTFLIMVLVQPKY